MADTESTMRWLDFSAHGVKLRLFRLTDNSVNLVLTGIKPGSSESRAVQELGFVPSASGKTLMRQGSDVQTRALRAIFPRHAVRDLPVSEVWMAVKGQAPISAVTATREPTVLGRNRDGATVRQREDGSRYAQRSDGQLIDDQLVARLMHAGEAKLAANVAAGILRVPKGLDVGVASGANHAPALAQCADAFVGEMLAGRNMDSADLRLFGGIIHTPAGEPVAPLDVSDLRLRELQEAVEASMQRSLAAHHQGANEAAYRFAVGLTEHQPIFGFRTSSSVANQQYSTPLPMSIAAQAILGDTAAATVFEPTIGNGSLVTALPATTSITGVEIDPARVGRVNSLLADRPDVEILTGDVLQMGDDLPRDFDFVIANPPFGGLQPAARFEDVRVNRIDHLIALNALARRTDDGRAVFILAGDRESLINPGKIAGGSKSFLAWLADHYEIEDAVELDAALFRKQGAEYPVRMVTVGRRRTAEETQDLFRTKAARLGERLRVVNTWDELWIHTQTLVHRLQEGRPNKHPTVYDKSARLRAELIESAQQLATAFGLQPSGAGLAFSSAQSEDTWNTGKHGTDEFLGLRVYTPLYTNKRRFAVTRFFGGQYASGTYDSPELAERSLRAVRRDEFATVPESERVRTKADNVETGDAGAATVSTEVEHDTTPEQINTEDLRASAIAYLQWRRQEGVDSLERVMPGLHNGKTFQTGRPLVRAGHLSVDGRAEFPLKELWAESALNAQANRTSPDAVGLQTALASDPPVATAITGESEQDREAVVNDFQAPYLPASTLNEPTAIIPRNLEGPVRRALSRLTEEIGMDVDTYVSAKLQMSPEDMELAFSAEQVDAIALAIKRTEEGRGFINGDQTGQGKGRVLAALARYAVLNNVPVVFNTEKANLFSDFWRDLKDIDSAHLFRPLILNGGEAIRNMETGQIEHRSIKPAELQALMDGDSSLGDSGYNLMLSTYSQFNREGGASRKSAWLPAAARGAMMLLDESHVAAGDSNTAVNMGIAIEHAASGVYSSATFAKNAKNIDHLIPRIAACVQNLLVVEPHDLVRQHGTAYAEWLADARFGRATIDGPALDMVADFCDMVERESRVSHVHSFCS